MSEHASHMQLDIVSAEAEIFSDKVSFAVVSGKEGELGIAPGHAQLLAKLRPGLVRTTLLSGEEKVIYISGGMMEVQPTHITVLADMAEDAEALDQAAALKAKENAEKELSEKDSDVAHIKLMQAIAQLKAIETVHRHRRHG